MRSVRLPLLTAFLGSAAIFLLTAYAGYRVTVKAEYRRLQGQWFASLDRKSAEHLRDVGLVASSYELKSLAIQSTSSSLQSNVEDLNRIRQTAPAELVPVIDLRLAKDYAMMARLEALAKDEAAADAHRQRAGGILRSLGWREVSEDSLNTLGDQQLQSRLKF